MRSRPAILAAALLLAAGAPARAQEYVRGIAVDRDAAIRIYSLAGQITVTGWDRDSVHLEARLPPGTGQFFGGGAGGTAKFGIEGNDPPAPPPARIVARVPAGARLWIKTGDATVQVSGVAGGLDVYAVGGRVTVEGPVRELNVEAMDAEIRVTGGADWARLKSAGGPVWVRGGAEDLEVTSVSGRVDVEGGPLARARIETVTGELRFAAQLDRRAIVDLRTHAGPVVLALPAGTGADVTGSTLGGRITNLRSAERPGAGTGGRGEELETRLGDGSGAIRIRTFKGDIRLEAAPGG